jgi:hypothetical protein
MDTKITVMLMSEVIKFPRLVGDIVRCYMEVFNAVGQGEWGESWTEETAHARLFGDADKVGAYAHVTILHEGIKTVGFTVTVTGPLDQVVTAAEMPPAYSTDQHAAAVRDGIRHLTGQENPVVIIYRDIGIMLGHRRGLGLAVDMVVSVLPHLQCHGAVWGGGWTVRNSKLFGFLNHFQFKIAYDFGDSNGHVVIGEEFSGGWERLRKAVGGGD